MWEAFAKVKNKLSKNTGKSSGIVGSFTAALDVEDIL